MDTCASPPTGAPSTFARAGSSTWRPDCRTPSRQSILPGFNSRCSTRTFRLELSWCAHSRSSPRATARPGTWETRCAGAFAALARRATCAKGAPGYVPLHRQHLQIVLLTDCGKTMSVFPDPIDSRTHRVLAGAGSLDVRAIAEQVGLHTNTVRCRLDQLMEAGLVESAVQERTTPGRPRLLFRATATPGAGAEGSYKVLAEVLASGIRAGGKAPGALPARA